MNSRKMTNFVAGKNTSIMDEKDFRQLSDSEFKAALIATLNLKKEWMASVDKREKELGIR